MINDGSHPAQLIYDNEHSDDDFGDKVTRENFAQLCKKQLFSSQDKVDQRLL